MIRLRWDSVTASRDSPCRPLGSRSLNLRLPEATACNSRTEAAGSRPVYPGVSACKRPGRRPRLSTIASVRRGVPRQIVALLAAVAAAALLAACGGSDSDSSSSDSTATTTAAQDKGGETSGEQGSGGDSKKSGGKDQGGGEASGGGQARSADVATPLKVSGGGSEQFRVKGGDNSIQEYGDESDESELQEVAEIVHGFYVARAERRWERACGYLAQSMIDQLQGLASQSEKGETLSCGQVLKAFTRPLPARVARETTVVDAGSFRHDGDRGFLIYYDAEHKAYAIPLEDEDGEWRLTLLSATPLG